MKRKFEFICYPNFLLLPYTTLSMNLIRITKFYLLQYDKLLWARKYFNCWKTKILYIGSSMHVKKSRKVLLSRKIIIWFISVHTYFYINSNCFILQFFFHLKYAYLAQRYIQLLPSSSIFTRTFPKFWGKFSMKHMCDLSSYLCYLLPLVIWYKNKRKSKYIQYDKDQKKSTIN